MKTKRTKDHHKHKAILNAAIRLFLKSGYSNTSMDVIAAAAKVTKQTIYAHYHSKDTLFQEIMKTLCDKHAPEDALTGKSDNVEAVLFSLGMGFLNMLISKEGLLATRLAVSEGQRHPKLARLYYESGALKRQKTIASYLERQNADKKLKIPNAQSAASYFVAMLKGSYYLRILLNIKPYPSPDEKEKHVRETVSMFMLVYCGTHPMDTTDTL